MAKPEQVKQRSNRRGEQAREAVLAGAAELFATRGYAGTSIADVAEQAGLSKPSILYHFADKDALWIATVEALWAEVEIFYEERWPRHMPPSRELVEIMVDLFIEAALRWPAYVQIPFIEGATPSWRSEWLVDQHFGRHIQIVNRVLESCQSKGLLAEGGAAHLQAVLTAGINMFVAQSAMWTQALGTETRNAEFLRAHTAVTINLTFRSK
jgi:AcrR family transcriptional regulator